MDETKTWASLVEKFEDKWEEDEETGCWEWLAHTYNNGHGQFQYPKEGKQQRILAHRFSYELHIDNIPKGMFVLHKCDVPSCVNPTHLFVGTHQDNMNDMTNKGRHAYQKGSCNNNSKLSDAQVEAIKKDSRLQKYISKDYGITIGHVSDLKRGVYRND